MLFTPAAVLRHEHVYILWNIFLKVIIKAVIKLDKYPPA